MKSSFAVILLILLSTSLMQAQYQSPSTEEAVGVLNQCGLLSRYQEYKVQTETQVALFKGCPDCPETEESEELQVLYKETAEAFEGFIYLIQDDLMDPKSRRYIRKHTQAYIEARLENLDDIYLENFLGKLYPTYSSSLTPGLQVNPALAPPLPATTSQIAPIVDATTQLLEFLDEQKTYQEEDLRQALENSWVAPNEFRSWEDIR